MSSNLSTRTRHVRGDEREMESGLRFHQLICEFESHLALQVNSWCCVTQASESWELVATVQFCLPRPLASLVQLVQDTALPALRHRFESGTMLHIIYAPVAQLEECDASNVEVAGSSPVRSSRNFAE